MEVTNEMIYKKFEQIDQRFAQIDQRFAQIDQRFEQIDQRFSQMDKRFENLERQNEMFYEMFREFKDDTNRRFEQMDKNFMRIEALQMEDRRILMKLWEERDNMKLSYTRTLLTMTGVTSGVIAMIVSFITGKAIIYKG